MKRLRVYIDTSAFGGYFDPEFFAWSKTLMDDFRSGRYAMIISGVTAGRYGTRAGP